MIRLEGIQKVYDDGFQALKDINLEFKKGELNVLIGPSGCGKTTTMKMLNRLIDFTGGKIFIDDKDISSIDPINLRRSIGYVIQHIGLFPHMTIYENVAAVPKLLKWDKQQIDQKVTELLNMVGLDPETFKNRYPSELSGGQQQRIGVIRALAAEPSIILMDEPFSALDPISREQLQDELVRLQREINKTIVFVTHDMDEALKIADQIILMKDGEVVQKGTPDDLLQNPVNDFVKDFIGAERLENGRAMPSIKEIMDTHVDTVTLEASITEAVEQMSKNKVDSLIVLGDDKKLKGYLSIFQAVQHVNDDKNVSDLYEPFNHSVKINDSLKKVLAIINEFDVREVLVVDNQEQYVGTVTSKVVMKMMADFYVNNGNGGS
jgi:osmoprotectant transport system ATP-binding protein